MIPLPRDDSRMVPHMRRGPKNRRHIAEKACIFLFLSVRHHRSASQAKSCAWLLYPEFRYTILNSWRGSP